MSIRRFARASSARRKGNVGAATRRWTRLVPSRRLIVTFVILGMLAGGGAIAWVAKDVPSPDKLHARQVAESTKIYDRTGTIRLYEIGDIRRTRVPLQEISPHLKNATVAV